MDQVTKMGPLENIIKMMPGMANNPALKNLNLDPKQFVVKYKKAGIYENIKQLISKIKAGPTPYARITKVKIIEGSLQNYHHSFQITH